MTQHDYDDDARRSDPNLRKSDVNPWAWVIGLLVLLALGWAVFEIFDDSDATPERDAIPAAGQIDRSGDQASPQGQSGQMDSSPRQDSGVGEGAGVGAQQGQAPGDRGDMTTP